MKVEELRKVLKNYNVYPDGEVYSLITNKFLKQSLRGMYPSTTLSDKKLKVRISTHRLIALLFIPNPENKPCVNHIDGNKLNNDVSNLEWITYSENEIHSHKVLGKKIKHSENTKEKISRSNSGKVRSIELRKQWSNTRKGKTPNNLRPVILNNEITFNSITEASQETGVSKSSICNNIKGLTEKTKIGKWEYYHQN